MRHTKLVVVAAFAAVLLREQAQQNPQSQHSAQPLPAQYWERQVRKSLLRRWYRAAQRSAMKTRPLLQFVADWNNFPDRRDSMLSGSLPEDCDENYAAAIAAVVHGLCSRDDYLMPAGLANRKASEDILISLDTADSEYGKRIRSEAVDVCWQHRVFFTADTLDKR